MKFNKLSLLTLLFLLPIISIGQIPKGHFLDADDSSKTGYKLKPFKQKKKGTYHYAVLTELPFENKCQKGLSEQERIDCSEKQLRELIEEKLPKTIDYKGNINLYLTVTKDSKIKEIKIKTYPKNDEIETLFEEVVKQIKVRPGKYKKKIVDSRLWTYFNLK